MTSDKTQLRYLIRLLEDQSIRTDVLKTLSSFSGDLEQEIERQQITVTAEQALLIRPLLDRQYREWLFGVWKSWQTKRSDKQRLETALDLLARFQLGRLYPVKLRTLLDNLADEYDARYAQRDALDLSEFLFQGFGLRGVEQQEYYNPLNSNLVYVIEHRRGIPISLACIYILVGERLGLSIEGCNFPGHFLAIARTRRQKVIVDCFNGGTFINEESLASVQAKITHEDILRMQCAAPVIVARVLRNLVTAYQHAGDEPAASTMSELLHTIEGAA